MITLAASTLVLPCASPHKTPASAERCSFSSPCEADAEGDAGRHGTENRKNLDWECPCILLGLGRHRSSQAQAFLEQHRLGKGLRKLPRELSSS